MHLQLRLGFHVPQTCTAFPTGIPDAVFDNERDHRQPVEGDGGVQFIAKPGDTFPAHAFPGTPGRRLDPHAVDAEYRAHGLEPISPYVRAGDERECICMTCGTLRHVPLRTLRQPQSHPCRWCYGWEKWKPWTDGVIVAAPGIRGPDYSREMLALENLIPLTPVGNEFSPVGVMCAVCTETFVVVPERIGRPPHRPGWEGCQRCFAAAARQAARDAAAVYEVAGLRLLAPLRGQDTKYPAECMTCGTVRHVTYRSLVTNSAPACWTCTHGIRPDEPHRVYLFRFPALGVFKVGITHNRHDIRLVEHQVRGGILLESVVVSDRATAQLVEAWVLNTMARWRSPAITSDDFPQGGWTETWAEAGAPMVNLREVCAVTGIDVSTASGSPAAFPHA